MKHLLQDAEQINSIREFLLRASNETLIHCLAHVEAGLRSLANERDAIRSVLLVREKEASRAERERLRQLDRTFVWTPREIRELAQADETVAAFTRAFGDENEAKQAAKLISSISLEDL